MHQHPSAQQCKLAEDLHLLEIVFCMLQLPDAATFMQLNHQQQPGRGDRLWICPISDPDCALTNQSARLLWKCFNAESIARIASWREEKNA